MQVRTSLYLVVLCAGLSACGGKAPESDAAVQKVPEMRAETPPAAGGIPARFVGVYEQDPTQCATAEREGAPSDLGLIVRADAIESYELGCQLRTVSASTGEVFTGVFDCAVEGETEERTRSLRWSGHKLFLDGDAQFFTKCNLAPPALFEAEAPSLTAASKPQKPIPPYYGEGIPEEFQGVYYGSGWADEKFDPAECELSRRNRYLAIRANGTVDSTTCRWIETESYKDHKWEGLMVCNERQMPQQSRSFWWDDGGRLKIGGSTGSWFKCPAESSAAQNPKFAASDAQAIANVPPRPPIFCDVKDVYGRAVVFDGTVDLKDMPASVQDPCDFARDIGEAVTLQGKRNVEEYCAGDSCRSEDMEKVLLALTPRPVIYSVGSAQWQEKTDCPAYLYWISRAIRGNVRLRLMGECKGLEAGIDDLVAKQGGTYGDYVAGFAKYTGKMPDEVTGPSGRAVSFLTPEQRPERVVSKDDQIAQAYAKELTAHWSHMDHCFDLMQQLYKYTGTGEPAATQMKRMDVIYDGADRAGCISH